MKRNRRVKLHYTIDISATYTSYHLQKQYFILRIVNFKIIKQEEKLYAIKAFGLPFFENFYDLKISYFPFNRYMS